MSKESFNRKQIDKIEDVGNKELVSSLWHAFGADGILVVQRAMAKLGASIDDDGWFGKESRIALRSYTSIEINTAIGEIITEMGLDSIEEIPVSGFNLDAKLKVLFPASPKNERRVFSRIWNKYRMDFGIVNDFQQNAFLAQMREELGGTLRPKSENLNYRCKALLKFGVYKRDAKRQAKRGQPRETTLAWKHGRCSGHKANQEAIANTAYADKNRGKRYRLGNVYEGDGWKFRGKGALQLTGRANYEEMSKVIVRVTGDKKFTADYLGEVMSTDQEASILSAFAFFKIKKMADAKNVDAMTKIVNRGTHSYSARKSFYNKIVNV